MKRWWMLAALLLGLANGSSAALQTTAAAKQEQPLFSFAVFSDTHVMANWNPDHLRSTQKFSHAVRDADRLQPEFFVINGDLTNGTPDDIRLIKQLYHRETKRPLYPTMGNHEYYYQWSHKDWNDARAKEQFRTAFGLKRLYYDAYIHGFHFIWLSPEQYMPRQKEIGEAAWLSDEQVRWFERKLRERDVPAFVFLHQPLTGTLYSDRQGNSTIQTKQLLAIAKGHKQTVVWFSGHTHRALDRKEEIKKLDNVLFVSTGSIFMPEERSGSWVLGGRPVGDHYLFPAPFKSQSRYVEVYEDRIRIRTRDHHLERWNKVEHIEPLSN